MTVLLHRSGSLPDAKAYASWLAVTGSPDAGLDPRRRLDGLAHRFEAAFDQCRETWWRLGRALAGGPGADLSHTVACGAFGSDFGLMLAWDHLVGELAKNAEPVLVICDDPWLFRQLARHPGVTATAAPPLAGREWRLRLRGWAARMLLALRLARSALGARRFKPALKAGQPVLLVYGHPASRADGFDAYFGSLMAAMPELGRLLHTDCGLDRAGQLAADGRTASLHGWGNPLFAMRMPFFRWRPRATDLAGAFGWLVRRAALLEGGGGGAAMNRWQMHCQRRFLRAMRPAAICWPWENHAWERDLCRAAQNGATRTVAYQHTVIGPHQINYSPRANRDGLDSLPALILADGPAYAQELLDWDVPPSRLAIGGAWRFQMTSGSRFDAQAPVFVPLSPVAPIAALQIQAARLVAASGRQVLVKEHPMYPMAIPEGAGLARTEVGITGHDRLSAVIYSTGTSGLESLLLGLPTFRLLPHDRLAIDVLPKGVAVVSVTLDQLLAVLDGAKAPPPLAFETVLAPVDMEVWKSALKGVMQPSAS
jgi:hypothetical protein